MLKLNLEIEKAIEKINQEQAKLVCIQLPDGLKNKADDIQREVEEKTSAKVILWSGTCFGACDIPVGLDKLGIDLIMQFGHSGWNPKLEGYEYK
jgi:diphthamide biosynthesis enzyme Dph1/Dph2-like protein